MRFVLAVLAGRHVSRVYRSARSWQTAREHGSAYLSGLAHGATAGALAVLVLLVIGS